eukprot:403377288
MVNQNNDDEDMQVQSMSMSQHSKRGGQQKQNQRKESNLMLQSIDKDSSSNQVSKQNIRQNKSNVMGNQSKSRIKGNKSKLVDNDEEGSEEEYSYYSESKSQIQQIEPGSKPKKSGRKKQDSFEIEFSDNKKIGDTFRSQMLSEKNFIGGLQKLKSRDMGNIDDQSPVPRQDSKTFGGQQFLGVQTPTPKNLGSNNQQKEFQGSQPTIKEEKQLKLIKNDNKPVAKPKMNNFQDSSLDQSQRSKKSSKRPQKQEVQEDDEESEYDSEYESEVPSKQQIEDDGQSFHRKTARSKQNKSKVSKQSTNKQLKQSQQQQLQNQQEQLMQEQYQQYQQQMAQQQYQLQQQQLQQQQQQQLYKQQQQKLQQDNFEQELMQDLDALKNSFETAQSKPQTKKQQQKEKEKSIRQSQQMQRNEPQQENQDKYEEQKSKVLRNSKQNQEKSRHKSTLQKSKQKSQSYKNQKKVEDEDEQQSYYSEGEESEYDEEYESEVEEEQHKNKSKSRSKLQKSKRSREDNRPQEVNLMKQPSTSKNMFPEKFLDISDDNYIEKSLKDFRPPTAGNRTMQSFDGAQFTTRVLAGVKANQLIQGEESLDELRFFDKSSKSMILDDSTKRKTGQNFNKKNQRHHQRDIVQEEEDEYEEGNTNSFQTKSQYTKQSDPFNPQKNFLKQRKAKHQKRVEENSFDNKQNLTKQSKDSVSKQEDIVNMRQYKQQNAQSEVPSVNQQQQQDQQKFLNVNSFNIPAKPNPSSEEELIKKDYQKNFEYELDQFGNKVIMSKQGKLNQSNAALALYGIPPMTSEEMNKFQQSGQFPPPPGFPFPYPYPYPPPHYASMPFNQSSIYPMNPGKSLQQSQYMTQNMMPPSQYMTSMNNLGGTSQAGFGQFMLNQLQNLAEQSKIDKPLNKDKVNQKIKVANAADGGQNGMMQMLDKQPFNDDEIKEAFFTFDMNGNGYIGVQEIRFVLDALGEDVTDEEIDEMVRMLDIDGDGQVNFKEFYKMASGQSLAPIGVALPPPRDIDIAKRINQSNSSKNSLKKGGYNSSTKKVKIKGGKKKGMNDSSMERKKKLKKYNDDESGEEELSEGQEESEYDDEEEDESEQSEEDSDIKEEDDDSKSGKDKQAKENQATFKKFNANRKPSQKKKGIDDDDVNQLENLVGMSKPKMKPLESDLKKFNDLTKQRDLAQQRKVAIKELAQKFAFDSKAVRKMHEVYQEQELPKRINFSRFIKFLKLDDSPLLRNAFELMTGGQNEKIDIRVLMLQLMNVGNLSKEEKLKFAFNLFDEEDSRMITFKELLKILQSNYFATSTDEVEPKAKLILAESKGMGVEDAISYEDFMMMAKKFGALFFPTNI